MKLGIIIGSTRQGRQTTKQAIWVLNEAQNMEDVDAEIIDLKDYGLPLFDEPASPRYNPDRKIDTRVQAWLDKLKEFDAYVFVTPEYNHSISGALKNAMDYLTSEINRKPSAIVSHGSAGGARAAMHLKEILSESKSVPIPNAVAIVGMSGKIDDQGNLAKEELSNPYGPQKALQSLLTELLWYSEALSTARDRLFATNSL